jgi:hypothetical protein
MINIRKETFDSISNYIYKLSQLVENEEDL